MLNLPTDCVRRVKSGTDRLMRDRFLRIRPHALGGVAPEKAPRRSRTFWHSDAQLSVIRRPPRSRWGTHSPTTSADAGDLSGPRFGEAVRGHWGIESMHWVLDVNFREDESRTRERTLGNNRSWLRRFAITRLKHHPLKESLRGKMQIAGWNDDFLAELLTGQQL